MKSVSLLGATGSIGIQTLDVIASHPQKFKLSSMSVGKNIEAAEKIIQKFQPEICAVQNEEDAKVLRSKVSSSTKVVSGMDGLIEAAVSTDSTVVVNAVIGSVGLLPTLKAIEDPPRCRAGPARYRAARGTTTANARDSSPHGSPAHRQAIASPRPRSPPSER